MLNDDERAAAYLQDRYTVPSNGQGLEPRRMRTIEVLSVSGQPLAVFQADDNRVAIEEVLKNNGWYVVSWQDDVLKLAKINTAPRTVAPMPVTVMNPSKNSSSGCSGCLLWGVIIFIVIPILGFAANVVGEAMSHQSQQINQCMSQTSPSPGCGSLHK